MESCTACGQSIDELDAFKAGEMITRHMTMYGWSSKPVGHKEVVYFE